MNKLKTLEKSVRALTVVSFILVVWVAHRALQPRSQCVNSSFISFVQIDGQRVENCLFVSPLSLHAWFKPLTHEKVSLLRKLEVIEDLRNLLPKLQPRLAVEISLEQPRLFELGRGYIRIGGEWLDDSLQTQRALIMGLLKRDQPQNFSNLFQLEMMTDFILMTVMSNKDWREHQVMSDIKFSTVAPSFADYCKSPFRSLAHYEACAQPVPDSMDLQGNVWGFRPLLAVALVHVFDKITLAQKMAVMEGLRNGEPLPSLHSLHDKSVLSLVEWFEQTLTEHVEALHLKRNDETQLAVKRSLKELEVEAPTHWELTVDITKTPAWKEILEQLKTYSHFRQAERTLVFTPEGAIALPSGLPVAWNSVDISSQTHVLIACNWPKAEEVLPIQARHMFARQTCAKVEEVFWN